MITNQNERIRGDKNIKQSCKKQMEQVRVK